MEISIKVKRKQVASYVSDEVMRSIAEKVKSTAKELCPVDTGNLQGSINSRVHRTDRNKVKVTVYTQVEYAPYVEFGTGIRGNGSYPYDNDIEYGSIAGQVAQPFMYPALKLTEQDILEEFYKKGRK